MFFTSSRYAKLTPYTVTLPNNTVVQATRLATPGLPATLGYYRRAQAERLDHVAARFMADATQFWRVCDANAAMVPDALAAHDLVGVPIDAPTGR
jgi:hypothetical protein